MANPSPKVVAELKARNQAAIEFYREEGLAVFYEPAPDNDKWFMDLMAENDIPSGDTFIPIAGTMSVLMVND